MKKLVIPVIIVFSTSILSESYSQKLPYPFEFEKSGSGDASIIFIPGFASSGEVWQETRSDFESDFTCYALTMAGFAGIDPIEDPSIDYMGQRD